MDKEQIRKELRFRTSRSSGAGGQHVNKTETKVGIVWAVRDSKALSADERQKVLNGLKSYIDKEGRLHMHCETFRSQHRNRRLVVQRLFDFLEEVLREEKERKPTKPSRASQQRRLDQKRQRSETKQNRKWRF